MLWFISVLLLFISYQMFLIKKYKKLNKDEMSYVATLTHDLKNPTYAQINILNMLLKGKFGELNSEQYEMLSLTRSSAKYMSNLVGNVLSGYKFGCNSISLYKTDFDLIRLICSAIDRNKMFITDNNLNVVFNHHEQECFIHADMIQLERVIANLLSNAITYGFKNTDIIINLYCKNNQVIFTISNKSNYIPSKELKNIFNKFSKTNNSEFNKASTGLGLYTAKKIISQHGGKIYAQSSPDGICTFGFRLAKNTTKEQILFK